MSKSLPTIKQIAQQLQVSPATVSRALHNHPRIGLQTREKVQKLAAELGYVPNTQAIHFKQKRSFVIGVIVPQIRETFFSEAISGMETIALANDYTILFGQSYDDPEREKTVLNAMKKQRVDGLLISLSKKTTRYEHLLALEKLQIPVVYFDRVPNLADAHKIYCNMYAGTLEMIKWLFKHRFRKIGILNGPADLPASRERMKAYIDGIRRQHLKIDMQWVAETDLSQESTFAAMEALLQNKKPPNALISFNDYVHMDAVQWAIQHKIKVNQDLAFVSYANLPITRYTTYPPLLSLEQFPEKQGSVAMQVMMDLLQQKSIQPEEKIQPIHREIPFGLAEPPGTKQLG